MALADKANAQRIFSQWPAKSASLVAGRTTLLATIDEGIALRNSGLADIGASEREEIKTAVNNFISATVTALNAKVIA